MTGVYECHLTEFYQLEQLLIELIGGFIDGIGLLEFRPEVLGRILSVMAANTSTFFL